MNAVLVQPDQLTRDSALLRDRTPDDCFVIAIEDRGQLMEVPFHQQRLVFVLSALRHFGEELREDGFGVSEHRLCDDPSAVFRTLKADRGLDKVTIMRSASAGVDDRWATDLRDAGVEPAFVDNDLFISARQRADFSLERGKSTRMESFYRRIRKAAGVLMDGPEPVGGQWNFDKENRRPPVSGETYPGAATFPPDSITSEAIRNVRQHFSAHMGDARSFQWPVTRADAKRLLSDFLDRRVARFGPYQDAMVTGEDTLYHSLLSACLNAGLLDPEAVCQQAEERLHDGDAPLNSVEGFIRQILGWREFVYQFYRANMPGYDQLNHLDAQRTLPRVYWTGETPMRCMAESVRPVIERAHSHHIQRLMVTGNFALLAGISPQQVNEWYWSAFIDAWHWVVTPNVIGMATFADGGLMASKPYAASANYIGRMSDYCKECPYNPKLVIGETACPFNALYWSFLDRNERKLSKNPRMSLSYRNLDRKTREDRRAIRKRAEAALDAIEAGRESVF